MKYLLLKGVRPKPRHVFPEIRIVCIEEIVSCQSTTNRDNAMDKTNFQAKY